MVYRGRRLSLIEVTFTLRTGGGYRRRDKLGDLDGVTVPRFSSTCGAARHGRLRDHRIARGATEASSIAAAAHRLASWLLRHSLLRRQVGCVPSVAPTSTFERCLI